MVIACAALALVLCACVLALPRLKGKQVEATDVFDPAYYRQEVPNVPGHAYLDFEERAWDERGEYNTYQRYDFILKEVNGVPFSIERVELKADGVHSDTVRSATYGPGDMRADRKEPEMAAYGSMSFDGGFPKGEFSRVGIAVYGNDATGTPLVFYHMIEF